MVNTASIAYNLDHYAPRKLNDNIFVLDNKYCLCRELIISVDLKNLIIGQAYSVSYSSINNTAIFDPPTQTIRASANTQKFSTIAHIDPAKTHIVKAEIAGINTIASQMCVIKCGELQNCEVVEGSDIVLNSKNNWEYKVDNITILRFEPLDLLNNIELVFKSIPEISPNNAIIAENSPLITSSTNIILGTANIGLLVYLSLYDNKSFTASKSSQNYRGTLSPGVCTIA
jgi:hypothetical protein